MRHFPDSTPAVKRLNILVVEDDALVREVLSVYLSEDEHHLVMATNGREGLQEFRMHIFDLILTDRSMPEMNGDEFAAEVRKVKPEQPIILLTGYSSLCGEAPKNVDRVVTKPFTLGALRKAIADTLRK